MRQNNQPGEPACAQSDGGDPTGWHQVFPGDPGYPTPEQWAQLKGVSVYEDGRVPLPDELEALSTAGLSLTQHVEPDPGQQSAVHELPVTKHVHNLAVTDSQVIELL